MVAEPAVQNAMADNHAIRPDDPDDPSDSALTMTKVHDNGRLDIDLSRCPTSIQSRALTRLFWVV
jgi:hypothetical protein